MPSTLLPVIAYAVFSLIPLALASLFGPLGHHATYAFELGRAFGLIIFPVLAMQPVLAARFREISAPYGLDMVVDFHKYMGAAIVAAAILHPLLLAYGGHGLSLLISLDVPWQIWVGKAALLLLVVHAGISLFRKKSGLDFERWRTIHDILGPAVLVLVAVHSFFIGGDIQHVSALKVIWVLALLAGAGVFVFHKFVRPKRLPRYTVKTVEPAAKNVWTLTPPEGRSPKYLPGQFHFLTFHRDATLPEEEHHFTISSSPSEAGIIASTIKESGDFTRTIGKTRPGDTVSVQGPFGRFTHVEEDPERPLVFIAGGIGITPVRAMLRSMADTGADRRVILLYANKTVDDIVFREELEAIAQTGRPRLEVVHILSRAGTDWSGPAGHVDKEMIRERCGDVLDTAVFFVCGPLGMARAVLRDLKELGVADSRIRREEFMLLD